MKLIISISANAGSAAITKIINAMAENPNKGRVANLLFKLPGFKLPSVRPATAMYLHKYQPDGDETLKSIFTRASDRKLITEYFDEQGITTEQINKALPFLKWMCKQLVGKSPYFKQYALSEKAPVYLLQFLLCGNVTIPDSKLDGLIEDLDSDNAEESIEFSPRSLGEIDLVGLKEGRYDAIAVAKVVTKLATDTFLRDKSTVKKYAEIAFNNRQASTAIYFLKSIQDKNLLDVPKTQYSKYKDDLLSGKGLDVEELVAKAKGNFKISTIGKNSYLESAKNSSFRQNVNIFASREDWVSQQNSTSLGISFYALIIEGVLDEFFSADPELASFVVLCTPTLSSAINSIITSKHSRHESIKEKLSVLRKEPWMERYVNPKVMAVSKLKTADNAALWVQLAELKANQFDAFLKTKPVFTEEDFLHLKQDQITRIIKLIGEEAALTSVFKAIHDLPAFKQKFLSAALEIAAELASPFGKIKKAHVKKNLQEDLTSSANTPLLNMKAVSAWKPGKQKVKDYLKDILISPESIKVSKESNSSLTEDLRQFVAGVHNVNLEVKQSWNIGITDVQKKYLTKAKKDPAVKVIKDVFHGTDISAAGSILMSGFRMTKRFVKTAQSMGQVLYVAPNVDKSLQYIGDSFDRREGEGIIFRGDILIKGQSSKQASDLKEGADWTFTDNFMTEEIGLTNPNIQFIVKQAYLVKRFPDSSEKIEKRTKFSKPVPLKGYSK
jgi:hypothetical protein